MQGDLGLVGGHAGNAIDVRRPQQRYDAAARQNRREGHEIINQCCCMQGVAVISDIQNSGSLYEFNSSQCLDQYT